MNIESLGAQGEGTRSLCFCERWKVARLLRFYLRADRQTEYLAQGYVEFPSCRLTLTEQMSANCFCLSCCLIRPDLELRSTKVVMDTVCREWRIPVSELVDVSPDLGHRYVHCISSDQCDFSIYHFFRMQFKTWLAVCKTLQDLFKHVLPIG